MRRDHAGLDIPARRSTRLASVLAVATLLAACSGSAATGASGQSATASSSVGEDGVIVYEFRDSSVPPPYHRSEQLVIDTSTSHLVIDSYGDVLADETRPTPPELWRALIDGLPAIAALRADEAPKGCVGGTGEGIRVTSGGRTLIELSIDECAGGNARLSEAIGRWIGPARDLFPPTEDLAPTG